MAVRRGLGKEDIQPILDELKEGLRAIYGDRLKDVILFGSYARGEARTDSDIDVAVVLDDFESSFDETRRTSDLAGRVSLENDTVVCFLYLRQESIEDPWQPVHFRILEEGLVV